MNMQMQFSDEQINQLLNMASQKTGTSPESLKQKLSGGRAESLLGHLPKDKQAQLSALMQDPQAMEQFMRQPQIQQLLQRLMGK